MLADRGFPAFFLRHIRAFVSRIYINEPRFASFSHTRQVMSRCISWSCIAIDHAQINRICPLLSAAQLVITAQKSDPAPFLSPLLQAELCPMLEGVDAQGQFGALFHHLAGDLVGLVDVPAQVDAVGRASPAAVVFGKALPAGGLGQQVGGGKGLADVLPQVLRPEHRAQAVVLFLGVHRLVPRRASVRFSACVGAGQMKQALPSGCFPAIGLY